MDTNRILKNIRSYPVVGNASGYYHEDLTGSHYLSEINYSGILSFLIRQVGQKVINYNSDLFLDWMLIVDKLKNLPDEKETQYDFWFGLRDQGTDHKEFIQARPESTYLALYVLIINVNREQEYEDVELKLYDCSSDSDNARICIYQINRDRDKDRVMFCGFAEKEKRIGETEVDPRIYDLVYTGEVNCRSLEDIFGIFNKEQPLDYNVRSLSVSDVIEIVDSKNIERGFYYCDTFGYKKIKFK